MRKTVDNQMRKWYNEMDDKTGANGNIESHIIMNMLIWVLKVTV